MRSASLRVTAVTVLLLYAAASASPSCPPNARAPSDNDIRLKSDPRPSGDAVALPAPVRHKIQAVAHDLLASVQAEPQWFRCGELYPAVFRISIEPGLYLYVADINVGSGVEYFVPMLYELKSRAVTVNAPRIHATSTQEFGWADRLLAPPLVSITTLPPRRRQVVFEERVHNGTAYNAAVYNYFEIGPRLQLTRVLVVEARAIGPGAWDGTITRDLKATGPNRLRLDTSVRAAQRSNAPRLLGHVTLQSAGAGRPYQIEQRHVLDHHGGDILITCSGTDESGDDAFLRNGYSFHY